LKYKVLFIGGTSGGGVSTINNEIIRIVKTSNNIKYKLINTTEYFKKYNKLISYILLYIRLLNFILAFKPDKVYLQIAQTGYLHQSIFLLISKLFGKETIAHFHAKQDLNKTTNRFQLSIIILSQNYIDKMIVLTEGCKKNLIENGYKKNIYIIYNFINNKLIPNEIKPIKNKIYFLYIGRMHRSKGIFEILEIANHFKNEKFIFIGNFTKTKTKEEFIRKIKNQHNCRYLGAIYNNSKFDYINKSKFFLFPTLWKGEIFPLTLIETMLCGCIPMVNPIGYIDKIIIDRYNGFIIKANETSNTINLIDRLLAKDKSYLQRISNNAIKWANNKYTSNKIKKKLIRIILK